MCVFVDDRSIYIKIMGITKTHLFAQDVNLLAKVFSILGHPARIAILNYLKENEYATVREITASISLAQSTVSEHLKVLQKIPLLKRKHASNSVHYYLHEEICDELADILVSYSEEFKSLPNSPK